MDTPTSEETFAYLPEPEAVENVDHGFQSEPEALKARARRARLAEGGLPVDGATLAQVVDAALDPVEPFPSFPHTRYELTDRVPDDVSRQVDEYLAHHPEASAGRWAGWRAGRRAVCVGIVGDIETHRVALEAIAGDRVVVEPRRRSEQDIFAAGDAFEADLSHFCEMGIEVLSWGGVDLEQSTYEVKVVGRTAKEVQQLFAGRYGPAIHVTWLGPTPDHQVLHPFGSWSEAGTTLRVWFGLDYNAQSYAGIYAVESDERVDVGLLSEEPADVETLVGGFRPMHADVTLHVPVGDRIVVDASTGERRPSLAALRAGRTSRRDES